jgi:hypothetical protein
MNPENQEQSQQKLDDITDHVKDYVNTRYEIFRLKIVDKMASISSNIAAYLLIILISIMMLVLLSIGAAVYISYLTESRFSGFFIVSAFYLLGAIVCYFGRESFLKRPFANKIIDKLLND